MIAENWSFGHTCSVSICIRFVIHNASYRLFQSNSPQNNFSIIFVCGQFKNELRLYENVI